MTTLVNFRKIKGNRSSMVAAYNITPIRRFQCAPDKPVRGLYKECTDQAYQFTAQARKNPGPTFTFYTGHAVGDELLDLLKQKLPPLETWEKEFGGGGGAVGSRTVSTVDPFNASILRLLNLFFLRYDLDPTKPSGQMFADINRNPGTPQHRCALALNTILIQHKETSTSLVKWLMNRAGTTRKIRPYDFVLLHNHLTALTPPPPIIAICSPY